MHTDEQLIIAYRQGDAAAFDALVRRYQASLFRFLRRMLQDDGLAEDALVETFFKLHRAAPTWEPRARLSTFLFTLAYREAINVRRSRRSDALLDSLTGLTDDGEARDRDLASDASDSEMRLLARQDVAVLERVLRRLPEVQRATFLLYYQEELSTDEIAASLEIPVGSVRAYLTMARKAFREALENAEREPGRRAAQRRGP